ncbi:MAG TPA: CvpA family protein [Pyrinomonadaceae bacterium]|nr:CvpA family protein [Pyrinomonadaceae bacterium]
MNFVDLLLVLLVLASVALGWQRGFILGLLDLVRWIGSFIVALRFYRPVAAWLTAHTSIAEVWNVPLAFLLVATLTGILIQLLGHQLVKRLPRDIHRRRLNRVAGLLPGLASGLIFAAVAAPLLMSLPLPDGLRGSTRESVVANRLATLTERIETSLRPVFDEAINQTINMRTIRPESDERVELPFKVAETKPVPELEAQMLELVNQERAAAGLAPLAPDPELTEVARRHSADMFARGYFSHITPEGRSPFDRMKEADVRFLTAGENLALAPTLTVAHNGLMNSPGHRANILRPQFGRVGIGIMDGGIRGLMVTQNFRN